MTGESVELSIGSLPPGVALGSRATATVELIDNDAGGSGPGGDPGGGNTAPTATDDFAVTTVNNAVVIPVLRNDSDAQGDALSVTAVTDPANGSATRNEDDTITYAPNAGFEGADAFSYTVSDGELEATATVTVTVSASPPPDPGGGNTAPTATDDFAVTTVNNAVVIPVLRNDSDAQGDALSVTAVTDPANGSATRNEDDTITYAPNAGFEGADALQLHRLGRPARRDGHRYRHCVSLSSTRPWRRATPRRRPWTTSR